MHTLTNSRISLTFDAQGRLKALCDAAGANRIPIDAAGLTAPFEVQLRGQDGVVIPVTPKKAPDMKICREKDRQTLRACWQVEGAWGALAVNARVVLPDDSQLSYWSVEVKNNTNLAIFQVAYPRVSGLVDYDTPTPGWLAAPDVMGSKTPHPVAFVNQHQAVINSWSRQQYGAFDTEGKPADIAYAYPGYWSMQFLAYGHPDAGGLYFGAYDSQALYKCFGLYRDGDTGRHAVLQIKQYPYDRTAAGADFTSFYECPVGVYQGEWWNASAIYREWALKQFWCAKGRTIDREDVPQWIKENDLWYWNWRNSGQGHPRFVAPIIKAIKKRFRCQIAFHWYGYNGESFDYSNWRFPLIYPHAPEIRDVLRGGLEDLHRDGVHCIYYLDARLVNPDIRAFRKHNGMQWICINEKGASADYWPGLGHTMCPTAPFYHTLICDENNRMVDECNMDGVYLDQVTGCYPAVCFNPDHGHGVGGHDHWVRGYRNMMTRVRSEMRARKPDTITTSEGVAECFLDLFDADLSRDITDLEGHIGSEQSLPAPIFHSVYHDYHISYGSVSVFKSLNAREVIYMDKFRYAEALALVGGGQLMLSGPVAGDDQKETYRPFFDYMQTLVEARKAGRRFFNLGRWLPPLSLECERVEINVSPTRPKKRDIPAVLSGCFELDGTVCVVLVNHTDQEQTAVCEIAPQTYGIAEGRLRIDRVYPDACVLDAEPRRTLTLPPMRAQVYMLTA